MDPRGMVPSPNLRSQRGKRRRRIRIRWLLMRVQMFSRKRGKKVRLVKTVLQLDTDQLSTDFYYTFWSLQQPFARPGVFADSAAFPAFKESVNKVLPFIKEATAKERAMMGNKSVLGNNNFAPSSSQMPVAAGSKRKRDAAEAVDDSSSKSYFFAKFLTSPDLLDLEVCRLLLDYRVSVVK